MSTEQPIPDFDAAQLRRQISAWCDGAIQPGELEQLQATLAGSEAARELFIQFMQIHTRLQSQALGKEYLETLALPPLGTIQSSATLPVPHPPGLLHMIRLSTGSVARLGWAALLLVGILAWSAFRQPNRPEAPVPLAELHTASHSPNSVLLPGITQPAAVLAHVTEHSDDCQWFLDQGSEARSTPADNVCGGQTIRATKGMMKLTFLNGTVVTLHAPALFKVISDMRTQVLLGKVTARVAKGAEGFSVLTPRATVIDLGTEFGIEVNEVGATDVVVFKGEVNLDYITEDDVARRQRLHIGEAMHLDAEGTASRIVAITDQRYSDTPPVESLRPPVITAVRDNIQRDAWNYYEIVQGGMHEDAKAFADRPEHEWNGVTTAGMPAYLIGGDYVKTFNNDKIKREIEITVTLNRAAKLYILFDKRIPPPQWLMENFRNTGDEIGVDEGVFSVDGVLYPNHHIGVGPGVSIDNVSTVWECDCHGPCSVQLGPTESTTVDINMYGIVAVPMDAPLARTARPRVQSH
jgi:hypothetical protein